MPPRTPIPAPAPNTTGMERAQLTGWGGPAAKGEVMPGSLQRSHCDTTLGEVTNHAGLPCQLRAHSAAMPRAASRTGRPTPISVADAGPVQSP